MLASVSTEEPTPVIDSARWTVSVTDGTLSIKITRQSMLASLWRPFLRLIIIFLVVIASSASSQQAADQNPAQSSLDWFATICTVVALSLMTCTTYDFVHLLKACGPRALHVAPRRWHASLGWRRRAEGDTQDLIIEAEKFKMQSRRLSFLWGWSHKLHLSVAGSPSRATLWHLPCARVDDPEGARLAEMVRAHVQRCRPDDGDACEPLLLTERETAAAPCLPKNSRWTLHKGDGTLRLQLPAAPWSRVSRTQVFALLGILAPLLAGSAALFSVSLALRWSAVAVVGSAALLAVSAALGALAVLRVLLDTAPRVLQLGRETYSMQIGWPGRPLSRQDGATLNLRAEEARVAVPGPLLYDRDHADDDESCCCLYLVEEGRPKLNFWVLHADSNYWRGGWDFSQRQELAALVDIITQFVRDSAAYASPDAAPPSVESGGVVPHTPDERPEVV